MTFSYVRGHIYHNLDCKNPNHRGLVTVGVGLITLWFGSIPWKAEFRDLINPWLERWRSYPLNPGLGIRIMMTQQHHFILVPRRIIIAGGLFLVADTLVSMFDYDT